jgi:drug/metabolite transporter (DMT)-like permease
MPLLSEKLVSDILSLSIEESNSKKNVISIAIPHNLLDETIVKRKKPLPERIPAFGLLCAILSVICWSIASVIVKVLTDLHSIEILVIRFVKMIHFFINSLVQNYFIFLKFFFKETSFQL